MTREEAIEKIKRWKLEVDDEKDCAEYLEGWFYKDDEIAFDMAIEALPERKTGKWIYNPYYVCYECSECGEQALEEFTVNPRTLDRDYDEVLSEYCPHCGSRMLEVENEDEEDEEEDD